VTVANRLNDFRLTAVPWLVIVNAPSRGSIARPEFPPKKKTAAIQPGRIAAAEDLRQSLGGFFLIDSAQIPARCIETEKPG